MQKVTKTHKHYNKLTLNNNKNAITKTKHTITVQLT